MSFMPHIKPQAASLRKFLASGTSRIYRVSKNPSHCIAQILHAHRRPHRPLAHRLDRIHRLGEELKLVTNSPEKLVMIFRPRKRMTSGLWRRCMACRTNGPGPLVREIQRAATGSDSLL
jgi:hypothetical protein